MVAHTYPTQASFGQLFVLLNTGTTQAPVWEAPCGFDTKSLTLSASTSEANLPACDDPDAPSWTVRGVSAKSLQVQGSGVMAVENAAMWEAFFDSGTPMMIAVYVGGAGGYRQGLALLTSLSASASKSQNGNLVQRAITLDSAGPFDYVTGAAPVASVLT